MKMLTDEDDEQFYLVCVFLFQIIWMVTRTWTDKKRAEVVTEIQRIDREIRKLPFFVRIC